MSRAEKQIEEMACDMCTVIANCNGPYDPIAPCAAYRCAKKAYEKGYRKQSEGEWKQTEEPLGWGGISCAACSVCGESWVLDDDALDFDVVKDYWKYCPNCGAKMKGGAE